MNKRNKRIIIGFTVFILFLLWKILQEPVKLAQANKYGIKTGEIIAEIPNENTVDVICKEGDKMIFYTYEAIQENKTYKQLISYGMENYFHYEQRKKFEEEDKQRKKSLVSTVQLMNVTNANHEEMPRSPLCGISTFPDIKYLQVNNYPVDKIIEYKEEGNTFYIWYFSNLKFPRDEIPNVEIKDDLVKG